MKIFLIIISVIGITMNSCNSHPRIRNIGYLTHVQRTKEFKCEKPQPRSISVRDLLIVQPTSEEIFYPSWTVLSRCDEHTGCCIGKNVCAPAEHENVELIFLVKHAIDTTRPTHHEIIIAKNHTRCHCVSKYN